MKSTTRTTTLLAILLVTGAFAAWYHLRPPAGTLPPDLPAREFPVQQSEAGIAVRLDLVADVAERLVGISHAGDGSGRLFLVTQEGRIRVIDGGELLAEPFLDISDHVLSRGSEQGLFSVAFPPDFAASGRFYVDYTTGDDNGQTAISRLRVSAEDPNRADPASEEVIMRIDQPRSNHNGGQLQFGPDGMLYIGTGDGGAGGDPWDNAESTETLLGKMLRVDVSPPTGYTVPTDNPFVGRPPALPEIWAYGLRNPWRFTFDRATGDLWIGDVGQNAYEEINFVPAGQGAGANFGWDHLEGFHCFEPADGCQSEGTLLPIHEYGRDQGVSVTGGFVYRGQESPLLEGVYLFADFGAGTIWGLRPSGDGFEHFVVFRSEINPSSFGEDEAGEVYVANLAGGLYRIVALEE